MTAGRNPRPIGEAAAELVALEGGALGGVRVRGELRGAAWYTADDWARQLACAKWSRETFGHGPGHASCAALRYVETGEWIEHPRPVKWPAGGRAWRWQRPPTDD